MKKLHKLKLLFLAALFGAIPLLQSLPAKADTLGAMTSYALPSSYSAASELVESNDGYMWTNGLQYNSSTWHMEYYVRKVGRSTGISSSYHNAPASQGMTIGPDGNIWGMESSTISKTNASTGAISVYNKSTNTAAISRGIATGPDGNIWFGMNGVKVVNGQNIAINQLGRISPNGSFQTQLFDLDYYVTGLVNDPDRNVMWYSARNNSSNGGVIGNITPSGVKTEYTVPLAYSPGELKMGPDGDLWFAIAGNKVGKMTPTGDFTFYTLTLPMGGTLSRMAWAKDGNLWITIYNKNQVAKMAPDGTAAYYTLPNTNDKPSSIVAGRDGSVWVTTSLNNLIKIGTGYTDNDEDGLTLDQETAQGSLDNNWDTDGDGLSDLTESTSYSARNDVFCDATATTCEYPDPTTKDIYVENDWMDRAGTNAYSGKLNSTQVNSLKTAYLFKGIKLHVDTGQLGGGNEVPYNASIYFQPNSSQIDFYDYKEGGNGISRQFNTNRHDIYHYLLTGDTYTENTASSGSAYGGDDDLFISYGLIKDNPSAYSNFDTAISGSVMHELGHNLCLTTDANGVDYGGQPASCRFSGIDAHDGSNYPSVMNYDAQFYQVNYSDGNGLSGDHDDWGVIRVSDFIYSGRGDLAHGALVKNPTLKKHFNKRADSNKKPIFEPNIHLMRRH